MPCGKQAVVAIGVITGLSQGGSKRRVTDKDSMATVRGALANTQKKVRNHNES